MNAEIQTKKKRIFGIVGITIGLIALAAAFLSPSMAEAIDPPTQSIEETTVNLATRIAQAAKAKLAGEEYKPAFVSPALPSRFIYPTVIILGMLAAALGILSLIKSEEKVFGQGAIALGIGAALIQWSMMIIGAILFIMLVVAVLGIISGGGL